MKDPIIATIAEKHKASPAQVVVVFSAATKCTLLILEIVLITYRSASLSAFTGAMQLSQSPSLH